MVYDLEKIKNDKQYITKRLESNDKRLKVLLQDEKVKEYISIIKDNEILNSFLQTNEANLRYSEMENCSHIYVITDAVPDENYSNGLAYVYHCLKCGLTNEYEVKKVALDSLDTIQLGMFRLFKESGFNSYVIGDKIVSLEIAKMIYQIILNENPNITNKELESRFLELYLQYVDNNKVIKKLSQSKNK